MPVSRAQKEQTVTDLSEQLAEAAVLVVVKQSGMTVKESQALRAKVREAGASFKVLKNTVAKIAIQGTQFEAGAALFSGPTAVGYSSDPVAIVKVLLDYVKTNDKIEIVGAAMAGRMLNLDQVEQLSKMPSLDELRGKLVGLLQAPASKLVGTMQAPPAKLAGVMPAVGGKLAGVLRAYSQKEAA